ncbi:stage VI sporulation protein D [Bacillus sp. T33-2]|uniref:stage VI sporulation protein D n=1 Tax=Bacillus sp. T33-2 TaxID=2054168 RepID=UPI000C75F2E0|nr:stage VI sporulation protein D [Bacillus sp. T33-2]PLR93699.1 stage VI sporulation protein D [Bacillus sp. T33-2]
MSQGNQSCLRFSLEESVWFQKGQEVAELISISLDPNITIQENDQYVTIRGSLELTGEYKSFGEPEKADNFFNTPKFIHSVIEKDEGLREFLHRFPVDVTIPNNRIESIYDIDITVESFDYLFPERDCLKLTADLAITGLYGEQQHGGEDAEEKPEAIVPLFDQAGESNRGTHIFDPGQQVDEFQPDSHQPEFLEPHKGAEAAGPETEIEISGLVRHQADNSAGEDIEVPAQKADVDKPAAGQIGIAVPAQLQKDFTVFAELQTDSFDPALHRGIDGDFDFTDYQLGQIGQQPGLSEDHEDGEGLYAPFKAEARKEPETEKAGRPNLKPPHNPDDNTEADPVPEIIFSAMRSEKPAPEAAELTEAPEETFTQTEAAPLVAVNEHATPELSPEDLEAPVGDMDEESSSSSDEEPIQKKSKKKTGLSISEFLARREDREVAVKLRVCIVQQGDSLQKIADRYDVSLQQLLKVNHLGLDEDAHEGQVLYIPREIAHKH